MLLSGENLTKHFDNVVTTARMPMQLDGDLDVDLDMDVASFRLRQRLKLNNRNGAEELEDPGIGGALSRHNAMPLCRRVCND